MIFFETLEKCFQNEYKFYEMFIVSLGDAGLKKEIGLLRAFNILIYM